MNIDLRSATFYPITPFEIQDYDTFKYHISTGYWSKMSRTAVAVNPHITDFLGITASKKGIVESGECFVYTGEARVAVDFGDGEWEYLLPLMLVVDKEKELGILVWVLTAEGGQDKALALNMSLTAWLNRCSADEKTIEVVLGLLGDKATIKLSQYYDMPHYSAVFLRVGKLADLEKRDLVSLLDSLSGRWAYRDIPSQVNPDGSWYLSVSKMCAVAAAADCGNETKMKEALDKYESSCLPVIAYSFLAKLVASRQIFKIGEDPDKASERVEDLKVADSLTASGDAFISNLYNRCFEEQEIKNELEGFSSLLGYMSSQQTQQRNAQAERSERKRENLLLALTISQVIFALIQYLGIKDILGDPVAKLWVILSLVIVAAMLISLFVILVRDSLGRK